MSASLSARNICIDYQNHAAVRDTSLEVPAGRITAIVGPSGCGKSSFLSALNRLTDLIPGARVRGEVRLNDEGCHLGGGVDLLRLRRRIGMVFQKPNPFPLSIRRNFELPLKEHCIPKDEFADRIESTLKEVGLWEEVSDRLGDSAQKLSGGQQQRLCIARALALQPEVILFDEPCSALDPVSSAVVEDHISALKGRVTVIIVTHNLPQACRISDEVAVFWVREGAGCLIESGPAADVFASPKDADTAAYFSGARG